MFCGKCGAQISEGAKFCGVCGAAVEAPAAEAPAVEMPQAPVMEAPVMEAPATQTLVAEAPDLGVPAGDEGKKKGKGKKIAILAVCAVAAVAVVAGAVLLASNLLGGKGTQAFFYTDQKGRLQFMANAKESTEPQNLGNIEPYEFLCSEDGKTWYIWDVESYDNLGTLYVISASAAKQGDRPQRVSKDVYRTNYILVGSKLLYLKSKDGSYKSLTLYCYDGKDSFELVRNLGFNSYSVSKDKKSVYYTQGSDGVTNYYQIAIKEGAEPQLLAEDVGLILNEAGADTLLFIREGGDIYSCTPGGEPELLVKGVSYVYGTSADDFYYTRNNSVDITLYDFVTDDLADADAALLDQELTEPLWYGEYYPESTWMLDGVWYYTDGAGINREVDVRDYMYLTAPGDHLPQFFAEEAAYATAWAAFDEAFQAYDKAWDQRYEAQQREQLREELKAETVTRSSYDIYHYTGSGEGDNVAPVAAGVTNIQHSSISGILFYQKADTSAVSKVVDIKELTSADDIYRYIKSGSTGSSWYVLSGDAERETDLDADADLSLLAMGDNEFVVQLFKDDQTQLESWTVDGGQAAYAQTLGVTGRSLAVSSACKLWRSEDGRDAALYFMTDVSDSMGTLCRYRDGEVTELADDVSGACIFPESDTLFVRVDQVSDGNATLLRIDRRGKAEEIADKVGNLRGIDEDTALYTSNGDLYCWDGKDTYRVVRNVNRVYTFPNAVLNVSAYSGTYRFN